MASLYTKLTPKSISLIALLLISLTTHFLWFGHPNTTVFDEVHFGKFISAYFTHEYYFDIHPPLGKLILAAWGWLWGFRPGFSFANIGDSFPDNTYMALRFLPSLAGALLPLVIYGLARQMKLSHWSALLAGLFIALDNALIVQSRLILLDSFLLLFGFGALWCYFRWRNGGHPYLLAAAGILGAMAMGIKWTGATFLGLIFILEMLHLWKDRHGSTRHRISAVILSLIVAPILLYYAVFMVHFALLTKTGSGDAFMSPEFQHDLAGNSYATDTSLGHLPDISKFLELNVQMYESNQRLTATHPYSSKWYTWPLMTRPIFYWVKGDARIYLLGNPVIWWASTVALVTAILSVLLSKFRRIDPTLVLLGTAWAMNMLPFIGIGRVMFLYHYFTALIWAILILAYLINHIEKPTKPVLALGLIALASFIYFAPLTYGLPLSSTAYDARTWLPSWK